MKWVHSLMLLKFLIQKYEGKLRIPIRLKNRIEMLAKERKISFNKMVNIILELGIYELLEEEAEYGKIKHKQVNSK